MGIFKLKLVRSTFTLSPFTSEQMQQIGQDMLDQKMDRISRHINSQDQEAKPLAPHYARRKETRGRAPVRDWFFSGRLKSSLRVKFASENKVTLGNTREEVERYMSALRALDEMWSDSPNDTKVLEESVGRQLRAGAGKINRVPIGETIVA